MARDTPFGLGRAEGLAAEAEGRSTWDSNLSIHFGSLREEKRSVRRSQDLKEALDSEFEGFEGLCEKEGTREPTDWSREE